LCVLQKAHVNLMTLDELGRIATELQVSRVTDGEFLIMDY